MPVHPHIILAQMKVLTKQGKTKAEIKEIYGFTYNELRQKLVTPDKKPKQQQGVSRKKEKLTKNVNNVL